MNQRILVTGSEGYIGSVLMPLLAEDGHRAVGLDAGWFADGALVQTELPWDYWHCDVRDVTVGELAGFDAVVHLAALSNDPLGEIDSQLTYEINYHATVRLAELARAAGVRRFVFSSSCSMYGQASSGLVDESAGFCPQTAYAESKVLAEKALGDLATDSFSPIYLRNATAYGISPRQRFDIVVPNLSGYAHTTGKVALKSDGSAWRPLVHVRDICHAIRTVLEAPVKSIHNEAFNIGARGENYKVLDIARKVELGFPASTVTFAAGERSADTRSYQVDFSKACLKLPGFKPSWNLERGVAEAAMVYKNINLTTAMFEDPLYTRLKQIRRLLETGALNSALRWSKPVQQSPRKVA